MSLTMAVHNAWISGKIGNTDDECRDILAALHSKDTKELRKIYNKYFYKGKFIYE